MKKLMMAAAIVCAAIAANATSIKWGLNAGESLDTSKVDTGTFYLVYTTGTMNWSAFNKEAGSTYSKTDLYTAGATDVFDSFDYDGTTTISASTTITPTTTGPDSGNAIGGGAKNFYYICIDDDGQDIAYTSSAKASNVTPSPMAIDATAMASSFSYAHIDDPEPTPEPTSALLMLLGVAGLALKRKQK